MDALCEFPFLKKKGPYLHVAIYEVASGTRKRKKRVRLGESDDSDTENQPPSSVPRIDKDKIFAKAKAELASLPEPVVLGKPPLDGSAGPKVNSSGNEEDTSPEHKTAVDQDVVVAKAWAKPAGVGCPGQLKALTLQNFMCHEHLQMEFGPNVNFISGQNGSGKSAVLQAIQQVLGVKARETGRATSQASFIKEGCPEARIMIKLWNEGPQAYLPDVFGKEVVIQRRIGRSSSYSIMNAEGQKVGHKREDLDAILDAFQINASNPISVMTQDTTRSFMDGGSEKRDREKYDIYMEATMLARIADANAAAATQLKSMHAEVESEQEKHNALKKELNDLEKKMESLDELEQNENEVSALQNALAWAIVAKAKADVARLDQQVTTDGPGTKARATEDLSQAQEDLKQLQSAIREQVNALANHTVEMEALTDESKAVKEEHSRLQTELKKAKKALKSREEAKEASVKVQQELLESLKKTQAEAFAVSQAEMEIYQAQEELLKMRLQETGDAIESGKKENSAQMKNIVESQKEYNGKMEDLDYANNQVRELEEEIAAWETFASNPLSKFGGPNSVDVVKAIKANAGRFHQLPVGPIGSLVVLNEAEWAQPVENALGTVFNYFLVHDKHDYSLLKSICMSEGVDFPACMVGRLDLQVHDVQQGLPPAHIITMHHLLTCRDKKSTAAILNALIDQASMEKQALALSENELKSAVRDPAVLNTWMPDGSVVRKRLKTNTFFPASSRQRNPRVGVDDAGIIGELKDSLSIAQEEAAIFQKEADDLYRVVKSKKDARQKVVEGVNKLKAEKRDVEVELRNILQERNTVPLFEEEDVEDQLKAEIKAATQDVNDRALDVLDAQTAADRAAEAEADCKRKLAGIKDRIGTLETTNRQAIDDQSMHEDKLNLAKEKVAAREDFNEELDRRLEIVTDAKQKFEDALKQRHEKALQCCSEEEGAAALESYKANLLAKNITEDQLGPNLLPEVLAKKIEKLQKKIAEQASLAGGTRDVLKEKVWKIRRRVKLSNRNFQDLCDAYLLLKQGLDWRDAQYNRMEKMVGETVNRRFNYYLNKKGHNGSIKVKKGTHKETGEPVHALEIKVIVDGSSKGGRVKDLKQLSGGERSFTTVAFSLALGEFTGSPFRAMDEFDVFMDAINRQTSLESLLTNALEQRDLQFLLLTPLDVSAVEGAKTKIKEKGVLIENEFVRILRMRSAR